MNKFKFKKKYGQNFLTDNNISNKIVDSINPTPDDLIIEIGPGAGALTKKLKNYNSTLVAFEIDEETKKFLLPLEDDKTHIIYNDFLNIDLKSVLSSYTYNNLYIIGNLPYYITTPIIEKIIDSDVDPISITIMVQKEVGQRFLAKPSTKDYGYMTVLLNYNFELEKVCDAPSSCFNPKPKVDSMVIKLNKRNKEQINYNKFKTILKQSFQFKRKTIYNNLKNYNKMKLENILQKNGYSLNNRAENIDYKTFIQLSENL